MASEVKLQTLQKQVDDLKRKLRDCTHEKVQAINRINQDWEKKLSSQVSIALKRLQADHDIRMTSLQSDIALQVDREVAAATSGKEAEIRRMKEALEHDKGAAVKLACFKTEDKYSEVIKQIEAEWKSRENALTREIFHISGDREDMTKQLSLLKQADMEKAAIIRNLNCEHEKSVKEMIESSKQEQSKEYTKFKSLEKYAQDKESEVTRLQSRNELIKVEKEILERQVHNLKRVNSSPDSSPNVSRIMRYTDRERELTKKIRDLEEKVKSLQHTGSTLSSYPVDTMSPAKSVSSDVGEVKLLREQVKMLEERCCGLQQKSNIPERDSIPKESIEAEFLERELRLKEKHQKEIDVLENESRNLRNGTATASSQSGNDIEGMQAVIDRYDRRYKQLSKDSIMNQQAYSFWSESEAIRVLREEYQEKTADLEELKTQNQSLIIRCDGLKEEYRAIQGQSNTLIEEREVILSEKIGLHNELETLQETKDVASDRIRELVNNENNLREANDRLKFEEERISVRIDTQIQEISLLKSYETEVKECRALSEKFIQEQSKEKELMAIIQTLEDQNSYLQSELQLKDDKVSDLTSVISNLTEKLKLYRNSEMNEVNGNEGSEVLFYPQVAKVNKNRNNNNNNNNNNDDGECSEAIEDTQPEVAQELDAESYKSDGEIAPLSLSTADQLSTDSTDSTDTRDEQSLSVLTEMDKPADLPCPDLNLSGESIEEWSHASEEEGRAPSPPNISPIPTPDKAAKTRTPDLFLVRYNYDPVVSSPNPNPEQELPLTAGDCIYIYGNPDEDGFYLGELNGGRRGLVPSNFVERVPPPPPAGSQSDDFTKDSLPTQEEKGAVGLLGLYTQEAIQLNSPYATNLSNIVEEDESLLDESNLTRISANVTSTESMDRCGTGDNSSTESLDKIIDTPTPVASPHHISQTVDLKVKYTDQDVELTWSVPPHTHDSIQGYHVSIGSEITHYIAGAENTFLSVSSLEDKLTPGRYTLVICTVTNHGYSDPVECTIDTTVVAPPTDLCLSEDEVCLLISWSPPDTNSLSSPLVAFTVFLNETALASVDYSDFLVNGGVSMTRNEFLKFYQSTPDQHIRLTVQSFLSNGRLSCLSEHLEVPLRFLTRSEPSPSGGMTADTESSEECSRHSSSSESEVLEVFRKSSLETDQLFKGRSTPLHESVEVVSKPPLDRRPGRSRQSFTPNEEDLFSELEAQGEAGLSQEMFSLQQTPSPSDSDNSDEVVYADIPALDATVTYYVALYDYNPTQDSPNKSEYQTELQLKKGEVVAVFGEADEDGFFNGQVDTRVGLVPYNLIEKIKLCEVSGETSSALLFQATKQAFPARNFKALYSYNPRTDSPNCEDLDDELSFKSGTSISIFGDVQDDGFYIGERNGELGFVPSNFIEPTDHIKPQDVPTSSHDSPKGASQLENLRPNKTILAKTKGIFKSLSKKS